jgi:hypothetical protein
MTIRDIQIRMEFIVKTLLVISMALNLNAFNHRQILAYRFTEIPILKMSVPYYRLPIQSHNKNRRSPMEKRRNNMAFTDKPMKKVFNVLSLCSYIRSRDGH